MPKVSVVIPTCNRPDLLPRAIQSVLNQTYQDLEIIVVDDGQEKNSESVVLQLNDQRIKYIKHVESKGGAAARNTGIRAAQGEFVAFLDDDDEWLSEKLERQVNALDHCDNSVVMVFCGACLYNKAGQLLSIRLPHQSGIIWPFKRILHRSYIYTVTIMVRKKAAESILFDEKLKKHQEWDFELRLLKIGKFYAINESLVNVYILGEDEHLGGKANIANIISAFEMFIRKHYTDYIKNRKSLAFCYLRLATLYKDDHRFNKACVKMLQAWLVRPWNFKYFLYLLNLMLQTLWKK